MAKHVPFRLNRGSLVLALISAGFAGQAGAVAGRVEFVIGGATAQGADGRERPLSKGFELDKGDTVKTNDGRAQIRFTDGAYVSLQPNTEFAIKDYNYEGKTDGSERGLFALARGAMRTVTGFIGRINRNRYQITTPTATVGIRGTGGVIQVLNDGATLINGTSGIWTLTNPVGTIDIPAGFSGRAPSAPGEPPHQTSQPPTADPAPPAPKSIVFVEGDERTSTGDPASLCGSGAPISGTCPTTTAPNPNPPLVSGSGYHVSYAYGTSGGSNVSNSGTLASAVFDAVGMLTQFSASNSATLTSGTQSEFGTTGGVVAWGRWMGSFSVLEPTSPGPLTASSSQGFHYVVGIPATAMPTVGSASFTFLGATSPTGSTGTFAPGTFNGTMTVNFAGGASAISLTAALAFAGFSYNLTGTTGFTAGSPKWSGSSTFSPVPFNGSAPLGYQCSAGCTVAVDGAFFGAGAALAGYAYQLRDTSSGNRISGAAVFKQ